MAGNWFARAFGDAVDDVRAKLIEESVYGRRPTERHDDAWNYWGLTEPTHRFDPEPAQEKEQNPHEIDR